MLFKNLKKIIVITIILALLMSIIPKNSKAESHYTLPNPEASFNSTEPNTLEPLEKIESLETISEEDINKVLSTLKDSFYNIPGTDDYKIDINKAIRLGIPEENMHLLATYWENKYSQNELNAFFHYLNTHEEPFTIEEFRSKKHARFIPAVILAAVEAVCVVAGTAIVWAIVTDLYRLSMTSFCKAWQKYSSVKKACKSLGYLK
ncbi:hypothetical protein [Niallia taxi]|uniref:hypothetical protein n=1 Tax=Niallia taxi TaxID=2499688 RepID=UPI002E1FFDC0|nr:hypothetical protein [Niallia taxi]